LLATLIQLLADDMKLISKLVAVPMSISGKDATDDRNDDDGKDNNAEHEENQSLPGVAHWLGSSAAVCFQKTCVDVSPRFTDSWS